MATVRTQAALEREADRSGAYLASLRALCELVASGGPMTRCGSITVSLEADGSGVALLRAADQVAAEFDVHAAVGLARRRGVIRISRPA